MPWPDDRSRRCADVPLWSRGRWAANGHTVIVQIVSPKVGLQRLLIAAPFVAGAMIAQAHTWSSYVVLIGLGWTVLVQGATGAISVTSNRRVALAATALFWVGPASWLWCGTAILTDSAVVASIVAIVGGYFAMFLWLHVTAVGRALRRARLESSPIPTEVTPAQTRQSGTAKRRGTGGRSRA